MNIKANLKLDVKTKLADLGCFICFMVGSVINMYIQEQ